MDTFDSRSDQVLVIDDDVVMRDLLTLLLGAEGLNVTTAASGEDALALLETVPSGKLPSVLLTDLKMPGLSAAPLAMRLRLACPPPAILVAMSASEPPRADIDPYDAFLRKPFSIADYQSIVAATRTHIAGRPATTAAESTPESQAPALDETIFTRLSAVMGAQLPQIYTMLLSDAATRVDRMTSAAALRDDDAFTREAHAIKGGCGMLGATEIHALAGRMEAGGLSCSILLTDFSVALERLRRILEQRMPQLTDG